jgi:Uma2 family endonuclease
MSYLHLRLGLFIEERELGTFRFSPLDVILRDDTVLQPDLLFVSRERNAIIDPDGGIHGAPELVIEILSPSTAKRDLVVKRRLYSQHGVREYWIVDPKAESIELLTQQGEGLETWQRFERGSALTSPLFPDFRLDVARVFDAK